MTHTLRTAIFAFGFTALGATMGITAGAIAGPQRGGGAPGIMKFAHALGALELTEAQKGMLEALREEMRGEMKTARDGHSDEGKMVAEAIANGEAVDREILHARIDEASAARTAMAHKVLDGVLDVYDTLDADQKKELGDMVNERKEHAEQRKENFGDHPRGRR